MMKSLITTSIVLTTVLFARVAAAEDTLPRALAPFVEEGAAFVVTINAAKLDLPALEAQALDALKKAELDEAELAKAKADVDANFEKIKPFVARLAKAPGGEVFVIQQSGLMSNPQPCVIIPVADDADATALGKVLDEPATVELTGQNGVAGKQSWPRERIGDAVVVGPRRALNAIKRAKSVDRPDVAAALNAGLGNKAAVRVAFVPDETMRNVIGGVGKNLGPNAGLTLRNGFNWLAVSMQAAPAKGLAITIKSDDAAAAKALLELIESSIAQVPEENPAIVAKLKPTVQDDRLVLSLGDDAINEFVSLAGPSLKRARESAKAVQSAANIRQMSMATMMYGNDHAGAAPASIADLQKYLGGDNADSFTRVTTNPLRPKHQPGYVYVKPYEANLGKIKNASGRLVIYEAFDAWPGQVNVGFADGHVEPIKDEVKFNALLAEAKEPE